MGRTDISRRQDDRGQVGGIEAVPFGILTFVVASLLVANAWSVVDAKTAVDAAAREATRHFVEGSPENTAVQSGLDSLAANGRTTHRSDVWLSGLAGPGGSRSGYTRCARVTFSASYDVPALILPWIGGFGDGFTVTSRHTELVDRFRDGVPGDASAC